MDMRNVALWAVLLFTTAGCPSYHEQLAREGEDSTVCKVDADCPGKYCVGNECRGLLEFECKAGQRPFIKLTPADSTLSFGQVMLNDTVEQKLVIESVGECNLTVESVGLENGSNQGFSFILSWDATVPKKIVPGRNASITIRYTALDLATAQGTLVVGSDDPTANIVKVGLESIYSGTPTLALEPSELNFGYVPFVAGAGGQSRTNTIKIKNVGTGNAAVTLSHLYLVAPGIGLTIEPDSEITQENPKILPPYDKNDPNTWHEVKITYAPTTNSAARTNLVVLAVNPKVRLQAAVAGSSLGPPKLTITPTQLKLADPNDAALALGMTGYKQVLISNDGASDLILDTTVLDPNCDASTPRPGCGDFYISPAYIAPLPPGATASIGVFYTPTTASDPASPSDPKVPMVAYLQINSNDTTQPRVKATLEGWAKSHSSDDVLKLELTFTNADNSWATGDFRNVDVELESPVGMLCKKPSVTYTQSGSNYLPTGGQNFCDDWNKTTLEGHVAWNASGTYEEPERILLFGLGTKDEGQTFTVRVSYIEDCAELPTSTLSTIVGIGGSLLFSAIGAWAGIPLAVSPDTISKAIGQACLGHDATTAVVRVSLNGVEIAAPQLQLNSKGDSGTIVRLRRQSGTFVVVP